MSTIELYRSKKDALRPLCNHSYTPFNSNDRRWETVSHYIYSRTLPPGPARDAVASADPETIHTVCDRQRRLLHSSILRKTLKTLLTAQLQQHPELAQLLLNTEHRPIQYIGEKLGNRQKIDLGNFLVSTGDDLYVEALTDMRQFLHAARVEAEEDTYRNHLKKGYALKKRLEHAMESGDDLSEFTRIETVEHLTEALDAALVEHIDDEELEDLYQTERDKPFPAVISAITGEPWKLVQHVRKSQFGNYQLSQLGRLKDELFDAFVKHTLHLKYPHIQPREYDLAIQQLKQSTHPEELISRKDYLYRIYREELIRDDFRDKADHIYTKHYVPRDDEVDLVAKFNIDPPSNPVAPPNMPLYEELHGTPIIISAFADPENDSPFNMLSPNYINPFIIDGWKFPTVVHALLAELLTTAIPGTTTSESHLRNYVYDKFVAAHPNAFQFPNIISASLNYLFENHLNQTITLNTFQALDAKFEDPNLQKLLIDTGNATLTWTNPNDPSVNHHVARHLTKLRTKFYNDRATRTVGMISSNEIHTHFNSNDWQEWTATRTQNMCDAINTYRNYLNARNTKTIQITPNLASTVLDHLYQPALATLSDDVITPPTDTFRNTVKNCDGFRNAPEDLVDVLWSRLVVVFDHILSLSKESGDDPKTLIDNANKLGEKQVPIFPRLVDNDDDHRATAAVINILNRLAHLNLIVSSRKTPLTDAQMYSDVRFAMDILVGSQEHIPIPDDHKPNSIDLARVASNLSQRRNQLAIDLGVDIQDLATLILAAATEISEHIAAKHQTNIQNRITFFASN